MPEPVDHLAGDLVGRPCSSVVLGGMSASSVIRVVGPGGSIVVKGGVSAREAAVYRSLQLVLADAGIRIPRLYGTVDDTGGTWLVLADIPQPLPRDRWLADPEVLTTLHRLHRLDPAELDALPDRFQPAWSEAMTASALRWLDDAPDLGERFANLGEEAATLFEPHGVISGDPNPLNWGLSTAGELVLMDWERIGLGHQAIDIAISVPGLPTLDEFDRVAGEWRTIASNLSMGAGPIEPRDLILAKLWTAIELLAQTPPFADGSRGYGTAGRRQDTAIAVAERLPDWLRRVT